MGMDTIAISYISTNTCTFTAAIWNLTYIRHTNLMPKLWKHLNPLWKEGVCRYFWLSNLQRPITPVSLSMNASPWRAVSLDHPPKCRCIAPLPTGSCFNIKTIYPGTWIFIIKIRRSYFVMAIYVLITRIIWRYNEKTILVPLGGKSLIWCMHLGGKSLIWCKDQAILWNA